ncbi:MAG: FAD binding domain-containing protein [Pseudomonadota bacterium]
MARYERPSELDAALALRTDLQDAVVLAGGTDVYPVRVTTATWQSAAPPDVLDISAVKALHGIEENDGHWRIGGLTTWTDIAEATLPPLFAGLQGAARTIGGRQIQNRGTLGGNLCNASPAADGAPCLQALDASIELRSRTGTRLLPMTEFLEGNRRTACRTDELLTAIIVPKPTASAARGAFCKLGARRYLVISIVMAAGVIEIDSAGSITEARISVGACSEAAQRITALEQRLIGAQNADDLARLLKADDLAVLSPIADVRASADYRCDAAVTVVRDLLGLLSGDGAVAGIHLGSAA